MKPFFTRIFWPVLILVLCYFAVKPMLSPGFFTVHDDTQPSRISQMTKSLMAGQFPVRMAADLGYGYGYPIFNFYAPLPYYVGAVFQIIGYSSVMSAKYMYSIGILLSGITMFYLGRKLSGNTGGIVAAVLYVYSPYHAVDIFIRGAVGEYYAMAFLPLVMLGIWEIIDVSSVKSFKQAGLKWQRGLVISSLGLAGTLLSHNIIGALCVFFMVVGLLVTLLILFIKKKKIHFLIPLIMVILFGIGLSAFFTLPAWFEKKYTSVEKLTGGGSNFNDHFVYVDQLWDSPWGYGGSAPGREDGMSFKLGKIQVILGLFSLGSFLFHIRRKKSYVINNIPGIIYTSLFLVSIFLMTDVSRFIWAAIPWFSYIQYPWRLLVFSSFSLAALGGLGIYFRGKNGWLYAFIIFLLTVYINGKYFRPQLMLPLTDIDYTGKTVLQTKISRISDEYLPPDFVIPPLSFQGITNGLSGINGVTVLEAYESPAKKIYQVEIESNMEINSNIAFFPGWKAFIDGKETVIERKNGLINLQITGGRHIVNLTFRDTPVRLIGNAISLLSLFLLLYVSLSKKDLLLWRKKRR